jgi:hypothetical protein
VEVAGVVGVDADNLGQQIAGHHELMIFESALSFRKSDLVLVQEVPTEHLVRRQAVHDRVIADGALADRFSENDARNAALQASHFRKHDIGATTRREVIQPLERLGAKPVVVVGEEDVFATSGVQADVPRLSWPA